jgi:hypothetical protein
VLPDRAASERAASDWEGELADDDFE